MLSSPVTTQRRRARVLAVVMLLAAPIACNVFASLDHCESDGDCPTGSTCDPQGKFCLAPADTAPPDTGVDTGAAGDAEDPADAADSGFDAPPDVVVPPCDLNKSFQGPELVKGLESIPVFSARFTNLEKTVWISALEMEDGATQPDLYNLDRPDLSSAFTGIARVLVSELGVSEYWPTVTADGKFLFFESDRSEMKVGPPPGEFVPETARIWFSEKTLVFGQPSLQPLFQTQANFTEGAPYLDPRGRAIYFMSAGRDASGDLDLFESRLTASGVAQAPVSLGPNVNTEVAENVPVVSEDELTLYFARTDVNGVYDLWTSKRPSASGAFAPATILPGLNTEYEEYPSYVSDDQCRLYFISNRPVADGGAAGLDSFRVYVAKRPK